MPLSTMAFVDSLHAANHDTWKSHTSFILLLNGAPVYWYSKRHQAVETSAFDSEFIALNIYIETIQGLRYKLIMFGIPIQDECPAHVSVTINFWRIIDL